MPTNLGIDDRLLVEAQRVGKNSTKRETVEAALREYIARRRRIEVLRLAGRVSWDPSYAYKTERERRRR
jgi:Arc/MetJ family transcription regulator